MANPLRAKAVRIVRKLELLYGSPRFITRFTPIKELVSCILSQHSADARSFPAFTRMLETFPTWEEVVAAGPAKLAPVIWKAGIANQKARSIIFCLQKIKERFGDYTLEPLRPLPMLEARRLLMDLPGVGPKTASLVLCLSFGKPAIPVDTHVFRVCARLGLLSSGSDERAAHDELLAIVPPRQAYQFHATVIQHGRHICRAPTPICPKCPVTSDCLFFKSGGYSALQASGARAGRARGR